MTRLNALACDRSWRASLGLLLAVTPFLFGMGSLGGSEDAIQPPIDLKAELVDRDGSRIELARINIGGRVQLAAEMGRGSLRIPFVNIHQIVFTGGDRNWVSASVELKQGGSVDVRVRSSLTFIGQASVGLFEIRARDIERIQFR